MRDELRTESSRGIAVEGMSLGQKLLAGAASVIVTALIIVLPVVL